MTVSVQTIVNSYTSAGTSTFIYRFQAINSSHIVVTVNGITKALGTDYAVTGVGVQSGGTITGLATVAGDAVVIKRVVPLERLTDYQNNGDLLARTLNPDFDSIWQALQQLQQYGAKSALRGQDGETLTALAAAATRAGKMPVFNASTGDAELSTFTFTQVASAVAAAYAAGSTADAVTYLPAATGAIAKTVQAKQRETFSIEDFRQITDIAGADTALVQRAFDSGKSIYFTQNYYVDSVNATSIGQIIDFNGYTLTGTRAAGGGAQYVMAIMGRYMKLYNVNVNANFGGYGCCVRWHSASAGAPAQYNNVYGLHMSYCGIGLIFGQEIESSSVNAPQSENTIYGFTCRGLQTPFVGNQSNGFITLVSPIIDCNPYEWSAQPGYNATIWNTAALIINNIVGQVVIVGGEALKTSTQLGYGIRGKSLLFLGTVFEIACVQAYVMGDILIRDSTNGYIASDSISAFTIATGATGTLRLSNIQTSRGATVGSYSGATFIAYESATSMTDVVIEGGVILEWRVPYIVGRTVLFNNAAVIEATGSTPMKLNDNSNCLARERGIDTLVYTTTGWYYALSYGGGSSLTIGAAAPTGKSAASLELLATGVAVANSADLTSAATIKATSIKVVPGDYFRVECWAKETAGNCKLNVLYYDLSGTALLSNTPLTGVFTTAWSKYVTFTQAPVNAAYMLIQLYGEVGTANLTDVVVTRFMKRA